MKIRLDHIDDQTVLTEVNTNKEAYDWLKRNQHFDPEMLVIEDEKEVINANIVYNQFENGQADDKISNT